MNAPLSKFAKKSTIYVNFGEFLSNFGETRRNKFYRRARMDFANTQIFTLLESISHISFDLERFTIFILYQIDI